MTYNDVCNKTRTTCICKILTVIVCSSDNSSNVSGSMFTVTKAKDDFMVDLLKFLD